MLQCDGSDISDELWSSSLLSNNDAYYDLKSTETPPSKSMATWQKYMILARYCERLSIADKRQIFASMRAIPNVDKQNVYNMYLPRYGITFGEFALFHTLHDHIKQKKR